jgi:hypothetical protein
VIVEYVDVGFDVVAPPEQAAPVRQDSFPADGVAFMQLHDRRGKHVGCQVRVRGDHRQIVVPAGETAEIRRSEHHPAGVLLAAFGELIVQGDGRIELCFFAVADAAGLHESREVNVSYKPQRRLL